MLTIPVIHETNGTCIVIRGEDLLAREVAKGKRQAQKEICQTQPLVGGTFGYTNNLANVWRSAHHRVGVVLRSLAVA